ncbi:hypothetical protein, partial [Planomonospora algeriensis]
MLRAIHTDVPSHETWAPISHIPAETTTAPQRVAPAAACSSRHSCRTRTSSPRPSAVHDSGDNRANSSRNATTWARFAAVKQTASPKEAPVHMLTASVHSANAARSGHRVRARRCARNHSTETPAAGHTRLRVVPSIRVIRPASVATRYSAANTAVRRSAAPGGPPVGRTGPRPR